MIAAPGWRHGEAGWLSVGTRAGKGGWEGQQLARPSGAVVSGEGGLERGFGLRDPRALAGCRVGSSLLLRTRPAARVGLEA